MASSPVSPTVGSKYASRAAPWVRCCAFAGHVVKHAKTNAEKDVDRPDRRKAFMLSVPTGRDPEQRVGPARSASFQLPVDPADEAVEDMDVHARPSLGAEANAV